jgi:protein-disulfide isomerase
MPNPRWGFLKNPWAVAGLVFSLLLVAGLGLFVMQVISDMRDIKAGKDPLVARRLEASVAALLAQTPSGSADLSRIEGAGKAPKIGGPSAKIRIVEFLDYQCPSSAAAAPILRAFVAKHPEDILLIVRDFPLEREHPNALASAIAARCVADQGNANVFWMYHDLLFRTQDRLANADLRSDAESVGADLATFDACVTNPVSEAAVRSSLSDGVTAGVSGTPTLFIGSARIDGAPTAEVLEEIHRQLTTQ